MPRKKTQILNDAIQFSQIRLPKSQPYALRIYPFLKKMLEDGLKYLFIKITT